MSWTNAAARENNVMYMACIACPSAPICRGKKLQEERRLAAGRDETEERLHAAFDAQCAVAVNEPESQPGST